MGPPSMATVAGRRFHRFNYKEEGARGSFVRNEAYVHFARKKGEVYLMLLTADKKSFSRVAPQLRLIIKNFRIKS